MSDHRAGFGLFLLTSMSLLSCSACVLGENVDGCELGKSILNSVDSARPEGAKTADCLGPESGERADTIVVIDGIKLAWKQDIRCRSGGYELISAAQTASLHQDHGLVFKIDIQRDIMGYSWQLSGDRVQDGLLVGTNVMCGTAHGRAVFNKGHWTISF